jgi:hypothetical protein
MPSPPCPLSQKFKKKGRDGRGGKQKNQYTLHKKIFAK